MKNLFGKYYSYPFYRHVGDILGLLYWISVIVVGMRLLGTIFSAKTFDWQPVFSDGLFMLFMILIYISKTIPINQNSMPNIHIAEDGIRFTKKMYFLREKMFVPWKDIVGIKYSTQKLYGIKVQNINAFYMYYGTTVFSDSAAYILISPQLPEYQELIDTIRKNCPHLDDRDASYQ